MQRFNLTDSDPQRRWFRVGTIDVTTTVLISALAVISMLSFALSPALSDAFVFDSELIGRGQLWRVFSWPTVTDPSLWELITIAIFFYFGSIVEAVMGRARFAWFCGICASVPAVLIAAIAVATDMIVVAGGLRLLEMAVILAFILIEPRAQGFFGIPFWVFGAILLTLEVVQLLGFRNWLVLLWVSITLGFATLLVRAYGLTEFEQIPVVPLPSMIRGDPYAKANRARTRAARGRRRGRANRGDVVVPMRKDELSRAEQTDMDALLEKISDDGIDALSPEERNRLDAFSRRLRGS